MKGLIGIAVVLGIVGTVLGAIALMDEGGDDGGGFEEHTLTLTGGEEERIPVRRRAHRQVASARQRGLDDPP